jgi:uncharacterized membrane protein YedE/YeeE
MFENFIADPRTLALGAVTGLVFGFLLHKGGVTRFDTIVGQFLFRDFTVLKVMLTAIIVGAVGVWGMLQAGMIEHLHVKGAGLLVNSLGGVIFGVGMALLGYCPGTAVGAVGQGSRDAGVGVLGMVAGAALFAEAYPWISRVLEPVGSLGKITLVDVTHLSPWWLIAALSVVAAGVFVWLELRERRGISATGAA